MRIAIIGSGVSGLSSLWVSYAPIFLRETPHGCPQSAQTNVQLLNEHSDHEVNIYEKEDYPGGHTHTVEFKRE